MPQALEFENIVRNKKALIVDDEKYILDFFVEILRMFPIQVDTPATAASPWRNCPERLRHHHHRFQNAPDERRELYEWIKETATIWPGASFSSPATLSAAKRDCFSSIPATCIWPSLSKSKK